MTPADGHAAAPTGRSWSAPGAGGAEGAVAGGPPGDPVLDVEVAGVGVLAIGDGGRLARRDVGDRGGEPVDVAVGGGQPGAGPDGARHVAAVVVADRVPVPGDLVGVETEQADQVGVGAEAAVADADAVLGAEPGGDERVRCAGEREGGQRQGGDGRVGPSTTTPGIAARTERSRRWSRVS